MKISPWGLVLREDLGEIFMQNEMRAGNDARGCGWSAHVEIFNKIYPQALLVPKYYQRQCADVAKVHFCAHVCKCSQNLPSQTRRGESI